MRRTQNMLQLFKAKPTFTLKRMIYVAPQTVRSDGASDDLQATEITGERFNVDDLVWVMESVGSGHQRFVLGGASS